VFQTPVAIAAFEDGAVQVMQLIDFVGDNDKKDGWSTKFVGYSAIPFAHTVLINEKQHRIVSIKI